MEQIKCNISKEKFEKYVKLRNEGTINVLDIKSGCTLTGLSKSDYQEIISNFSELSKRFNIR